MAGEREVIEMISSIMPKSEVRLNKPFESDSEVLNHHGKRLLVNVDEFSGEDLFRTGDPYSLGWNIAVGAVSDILASGGRPLYYAHSLVIDNSWDEAYIKQFSEGVAGVLKGSGTAFIGGDFGRAREWRCAVTVIGDAEGEAVLRSGASAGDLIYMTGEVGTGNFEAFLSMYRDRAVIGHVSGTIRNRFELRIREAELIRKYATACIDTSDGVFNSLNAVADASGTGYAVQDLQYMKLGKMAAKLMSMPKALLFLGECGEYELLFTVKAEMEQEFLKIADESKLKFCKIGKVTEPSQRTLFEKNTAIDLRGLDISARDYEDRKEYIKKLIEFLNTG